MQRLRAGVKCWTEGAKRDQRTTVDLRCGWRLLWKPGIFTDRNRREWFVVVVYLWSWVWLFCDPMDYSLAGSSVMGFSRQEYWCGLLFPSLKDLSNPKIKPASSTLASRFFTIWTIFGKPKENDSLEQIIRMKPHISWGKTPAWLCNILQ